MKRTLLLFFCCAFLYSQTTKQVEGIRSNTPAVHALKNLTIIPSPGKKIEKGTIVIRDGVIQAVGANIPIPADAREWDCSGMTAYAGMIDLFTEYGQPKPRPAQAESLRGATYWNTNVKADYSAAEYFSPDNSTAEKLRAQGFTTVLSISPSGIFKGSSVVTNLGEGSANEQVLQRDVFQHVTLQRSGFGGGYPNSLMG
ncbi:MAG: hypothetical protein AB1600_06660, partial [Bacteroidota bacterium]